MTMMIYTINYESWDDEVEYILNAFPTREEAKKCKDNLIQEDDNMSGDYFIGRYELPENIVLAYYEKVLANKQK